jgi:hypothetical protein
MKQKTEVAAFPERVLFVLACEVDQLTESAERVRIQIAALASQAGIALPMPACPS